MVCKNCGYQLPDEAIFCEQCGARVAPDPENNAPSGFPSNNFQNTFQNTIPDDLQNHYQNTAGDNHSSRKAAPRRSRTPLYVSIAVAAVLIIAAGSASAVWYFSRPEDKTAQQDIRADEPDVSIAQNREDEIKDRLDKADTDESDTDANTADRSDDSTKPVPETGNSSSLENNTPFFIDPDADANYAAALDPSVYEFYSSATDEFNFWYPANFYNEVTYNTRPDTVSYGTNIEEVTFSAKDGSQLIFQAVQRTDSLDIKAMSNRVYTTEFSRLTSPEVILNTAKDGYGKIIVTGWDKTHTNNTVYCLTKVKPDVILQMTVLFPDYTDETDRLRKSYLTECYYRMCGFSDADPWRTYEDFVRENG